MVLLTVFKEHDKIFFGVLFCIVVLNKGKCFPVIGQMLKKL